MFIKNNLHLVHILFHDLRILYLIISRHYIQFNLVLLFTHDIHTNQHNVYSIE